eukprot:682603-Prymnesium_polylepis.3
MGVCSDAASKRVERVSSMERSSAVTTMISSPSNSLVSGDSDTGNDEVGVSGLSMNDRMLCSICSSRRSQANLRPRPLLFSSLRERGVTTCQTWTRNDFATSGARGGGTI